MAEWRVVQQIKFVRSQPELHDSVFSGVILGPEQKGWSALVNEDTGILVIKAKKGGKMKSRRYPLSSIDSYECTAAAVKGSDDPADPK